MEAMDVVQFSSVQFNLEATDISEWQILSVEEENKRTSKLTTTITLHYCETKLEINCYILIR